MTLHETLAERFAARLDPPAAEALASELIQAGTAQAVLELLQELAEASTKVTQAAIEALPELRRRAGLADAVKWMDLGMALALSSGAAAVKYFRESPVVLGVTEPAQARGRVLQLALELADSDPNVALDFFRASPELLTLVPMEELEAWAEIGLELARCDYVLGIEFFRQSPAIAAVLPLGQVRPWVRFGTKLITENSLGKTDYLATLEFFRTSPAILGEIADPTVRNAVVSLGDQLAEREPQSAVDFLAASPALLRGMPSQDWSRRVLQYGLLVAERDAAATLAYLRRCPEVVTLFGNVETAQAKFEEWFKGGMEVLEYSAEGARAYFAMETKKALAAVAGAMNGVPLRQVARSLKLFVQGLCGVDVSVQALPEPSPGAVAAAEGPARATVGPDGRSIFLPGIVGHYQSREENVRLYIVMVAHEAGHLEFGTYDLPLARLSDLIAAVQQRYRPLVTEPSSVRGDGEPAETEREDIRTLDELFQLYPQAALMRDLWVVLEDARIECLLQREYPGLRADLAALAREAVATRSLLHGMSVREMVVDALLLLTTADPATVRIPDAIADVVERVWTLAQGILRSEATAEDAVRLADHIYVALEEMLKGGEHAAQGREEQETETGMGPPASEQTSGGYRPVTNWAYRGAMNPDMIQQAGSSGHERDRGSVEPEHERVPPPVPGFASSAPDRSSDRIRHEPGEVEAVGGDRNLAGSSVPNSAADELVMTRDDRRGRHEGLRHLDRTFVYDEWDGIIRDYRSRWCRVIEQWAPEGSSEFAAAVLAEHGPAVRLLRRYFQSLRPPALRRVPGQAEGEDLDLDAVVRRRADLAAGVDLVDRVYIRRDRRERDVAVAFLVDLSGSTSRQIDPDGRRVIDVEKESLVLLTDALEAVGDPYAVYGYSGRGRRQVDFVILKDFEETVRGPYLNRIGAVAPLQQNRDGAAIRHAVRKLLSQRTKVRLLMLISDGKPLDDGYADEYSLEDTKMALREARMSGVQPFCITVDRDADEYIRRMYGDVRYLVVDRIASLPERLPRVYGRLTA